MTPFCSLLARRQDNDLGVLMIDGVLDADKTPPLIAMESSRYAGQGTVVLGTVSRVEHKRSLESYQGSSRTKPAAILEGRSSLAWMDLARDDVQHPTPMSLPTCGSHGRPCSTGCTATRRPATLRTKHSVDCERECEKSVGLLCTRYALVCVMIRLLA